MIAYFFVSNEGVLSPVDIEVMSNESFERFNIIALSTDVDAEDVDLNFNEVMVRSNDTIRYFDGWKWTDEPQD